MADRPSASLELVEDEDGNVQVFLSFQPRLDQTSWAHYFATVALNAIKQDMEQQARTEGGEVHVATGSHGPAGHA